MGIVLHPVESYGYPLVILMRTPRKTWSGRRFPLLSPACISKAGSGRSRWKLGMPPDAPQVAATNGFKPWGLRNVMGMPGDPEWFRMI